MEKMKYYTIDWVGPFTYDELSDFDPEKYAKWANSTLYMIAGIRKWQNEKNVQYVGQTKQTCSVRVKQHFSYQNSVDKKFSKIKEARFWIGTYDSVFKKGNQDDLKKELNCLEHTLIHCSYLFANEKILNERAVKYPIQEDITILSRFFNKNNPKNVYVRLDRSLREFPDVIMLKSDADERRYYIANRLTPVGI